MNPFRYRSYYFDSETNLYFLKTRYYDPAVGRFISQDDISYLDPETVGGCNLYAYCGNNPVMGYDPDGTWDWDKFWESTVIALKVMASVTAIVAGIALCFVPGAQLIGAGLIIAGAGGLIGAGISMATWNGFNTGWDIGTLIGGVIGLAVAMPQLSTLVASIAIPTITTTVGSGGALLLAVTTTTVAVPIGSIIIGVSEAAIAIDSIMIMSKIAPRIKFNSRKEAREAAQRKGGGAKPRLDYHSPHGPHYHPNVPITSPYYHWHYYFPKVITLGSGIVAIWETIKKWLSGDE